MVAWRDFQQLRRCCGLVMPTDAHRVTARRHLGEIESTLRVGAGAQRVVRPGFAQFDLRPSHNVTPGVTYYPLPRSRSGLRESGYRLRPQNHAQIDQEGTSLWISQDI